MKAQEYPVQHFKFMSELASSFVSIPIQITERHYFYTGFGSWWFTCRYKRKEYRMVFDGRDNYFCIEEPHGRTNWEEIKNERVNHSASNLLQIILETLKRA